VREIFKKQACWFVDNFGDLQWVVEKYGVLHGSN
jgi:hypothetical protein